MVNQVIKMMATKLGNGKMEPVKFAKTRRFFKAAWIGTRAFAMISPFAAAPLLAQQQDTTKAADEAFFNPRATVGMKALVREFQGGNDVAGGFGAQASAEWGWLAVKGSFSLVHDANCTKGDGFNFSASANSGKFVTVIYVDKDPLIRPTPVYGLSVAAYGATAKLERDIGWHYTNYGAGYAYGGIAAGVTFNVAPDKRTGQNVVQKVVYKIALVEKVANNVNATLEASNIHTLQDATNTLGARFSFTYTLK